jgi:glutamate N-acetyltransferase/amino-acid N-acetyltransferase
MFKITPIKGAVCAVDGFFGEGLNAGFKPQNPDVGYIYSDKICNVAYTFTTNKFQAAPIKYVLQNSIQETNFLLLNSKNANAMTGDAGIEDIKEILEVAKEKFDITNPIMSSTGVIGVRLNKEKIKDTINKFELKKDDESLSQAIMTTDKYSKTIALEVELDNGEKFRIGAMAKGAGMINPAMATMLCFITTDANIPQNEMQELLDENVKISFNSISVDGDTSTNDSVFLLSNKSAGYDKEAFSEALKIVMQKLALDIVKDGEGSTKVVAFEIQNAKDENEAGIIAKSLTNSLLVKTAIFGQDPNWGRIASTIGASGCECDEKTLTISFEDVLVYDKGEIYFDKENESKAAKIMQKDEFRIICDLGIGNGNFTGFGCDLGYEYVKINADYRT